MVPDSYLLSELGGRLKTLIYLTSLAQLPLFLTPGVPEPGGELTGQGRRVCRGPDRANVTFPPDSLTSWNELPHLYHKQVAVLGLDCLSFLWANWFFLVTRLLTNSCSATARSSRSSPRSCCESYLSPAFVKARDSTPVTLPPAAGKTDVRESSIFMSKSRNKTQNKSNFRVAWLN